MSPSRKLIALILIVFIVLAGCTKTNENANISPEQNASDPDETSQKEPVDQEEPSEPQNKNGSESSGDDSPGNSQEPLFEVKDSTLISGWKMLRLRDYAYTTEDWDSYSFQEESPLIAYELHFPGNWNIEYSVFTDESGLKVAELFPPIIMQEGQSLLDNWQLNVECELISKEDITVKDYAGARIICKAYPHSGGDIEYWYPHTYYLTDGKRVFAMNFYALELDAEKQKQFDGIIENFSFID